MYYALMFLFSLLVVALVLLLEHRGDPQLLEREYRGNLPPRRKPAPRKFAA